MVKSTSQCDEGNNPVLCIRKSIKQSHSFLSPRRQHRTELTSAEEENFLLAAVTPKEVAGPGTSSLVMISTEIPNNREEGQFQPNSLFSHRFFGLLSRPCTNVRARLSPNIPDRSFSQGSPSDLPRPLVLRKALFVDPASVIPRCRFLPK
jgi:hypothetical protein